MTAAADAGIFASEAGRRRFLVAAGIIFWVGIFLFAAFLFLKLFPLTQPDAAGKALKYDFVAFWAAGKLAAAGQPLAAFDPAQLLAAADLPAGAEPPNLRWGYPALFMLIMLPFGLLPFTAAFVAFNAASAVLFALAVRPPAAVLPGLWRLLVVSPVVVIGCLAIGQTSALWTAGLVAALWAMRDGRAAAAGLAIALLTFKPQLGILIPVALLAARQWAVIGWASAFTVLVTAAATAVVGIEYWAMFREALANAVIRLTDGTMVLNMMPSPYGFLRLVGLGHESALGPQAVISLVTAATVALVWSRRDCSHDLKCATLCAAIPLATPYAFYYELTLTLVAGLFLLRDGFGRSAAAKLWLVALWLGPVPALFLPKLISVAALSPPILLVTLAICVLRVWRTAR